ncbi:MAG TPA: hypothetical protein VLG74_06220 [Blastocatellia bacterium]|nr:hypothetical protein [Blastocatellia bacterium]
MNRIVLILAICGYWSGFAFAMWALIPLEDLVQDTDVIVIGTLQGVSQYTRNGMDYAQGSIIVDEVVWGAANPGDLLILKWQNQSNLVCPRVEHRYNEGKKVIWLLTVDPGGVVRANHPGRFVELEDRPKVEQCLAKNLLSLRTGQFRYAADEAVNVSLVFRNPTQGFIEFPGVEFRDGQLLMARGVSLELHAEYGEELKITNPLPGRVILYRSLAPIVIAPRQEFRLALDLRTLFPISDDQQYFLRLRVRGFGAANDVMIYSTRDAPQTITGNTTGSRLEIRPDISRLELLMPSLIAIIVSSIFVYRHAKEMIRALNR